MIGRRSVAALLLLSAIVTCAIAAQSASAATANNTTAFTCVKVAAGTGDFEDAHCDKAGKGNYGHTTIANGVATDTIMSNDQTKNNTTESTPILLKGTAFATKLEISCQTGSGSGTVLNTQSEKFHKVSGEVTAKFTKCTVLKPTKCTVKEPIEVKAVYEGVEGLGVGKNEMGVEFKPAEAGKPFTTLTFEGSECAFKGKPCNVEGTAVATGGTATQTAKHAGVTSIFTDAMTKETLKIGTNTAEISAAATIKMAPINEVPQDPISFTTTT